MRQSGKQQQLVNREKKIRRSEKKILLDSNRVTIKLKSRNPKGVMFIFQVFFFFWLVLFFCIFFVVGFW